MSTETPLTDKEAKWFDEIGLVTRAYFAKQLEVETTSLRAELEVVKREKDAANKRNEALRDANSQIGRHSNVIKDERDRLAASNRELLGALEKCPLLFTTTCNVAEQSWIATARAAIANATKPKGEADSSAQDAVDREEAMLTMELGAPLQPKHEPNCLAYSGSGACNCAYSRVRKARGLEPEAEQMPSYTTYKATCLLVGIRPMSAEEYAKKTTPEAVSPAPNSEAALLASVRADLEKANERVGFPFEAVSQPAEGTPGGRWVNMSSEIVIQKLEARLGDQHRATNIAIAARDALQQQLETTQGELASVRAERDEAKRAADLIGSACDKIRVNMAEEIHVELRQKNEWIKKYFELEDPLSTERAQRERAEARVKELEQLLTQRGEELLVAIANDNRSTDFCIGLVQHTPDEIIEAFKQRDSNTASITTLETQLAATTAALERAKEQAAQFKSWLMAEIIEGDDYGVEGSTFYRCPICGGESGAGVLNVGIQHEASCVMRGATPVMRVCKEQELAARQPSTEP